MARIPKRGPMPKNLRLAPDLEETSPTTEEVREVLYAAPSGDPLDCPKSCESEIDLWNEVSAGLTPKDIPLLEAAFLARERLANAQREFRDLGPTVLNAKGEVVGNPAARIADQATSSLLKACEHLGLSPMARAKMMRGAVIEEKEESPEEIMFGGTDG